jgi:hypothetical protein
MKKLTLALWTAIGALALTLLTGQAYAQINSPVPSSAYIVYAGLDWAWAARARIQAAASRREI